MTSSSSHDGNSPPPNQKQTTQTKTPTPFFFLAIAALITTSAAACASDIAHENDDSSSSTSATLGSQHDDDNGHHHDGDNDNNNNNKVGLAIEVDNGVGVPLKLKKGQTFFLNQIDLRAGIEATVDEGVDGLNHSGDFSDLRWGGTRLVDQSFIILSNPDGTFTRRRFFRDAEWMNADGSLTLQQLDAAGHALSTPLIVHTGSEARRSERDDFFTRRYRAIQWTMDCPSTATCEGATHFTEEGLVELRYREHPNRTFRLHERTRSFELRWSAHPSKRYAIPVEQVAHPRFAYGFSIDLAAITPPRADGTYAPGSAIDFRITLRDGRGRRLHPRGSLPTYNEVVFGPNEAGIQYYRAFFDPTATYYRRKHRERMLMTEIIGPAQNAQAIRSVLELGAFLGPEDVQTTATLEQDGVFAQFMTFPPANDLFGGAFDPTHAGWDAPVSDSWTYQLPANAPAGTYNVVIKGRRTYLGEDIPFSRVIDIQVGSRRQTHATLETGGCNACHNGPSHLGKVLHGLDERQVCAGCHIPLGFELEGPIAVRTHFVHSRTGEGRFGADLATCKNCHLTQNSIQRTSKAACLSCHTSYPQSHVETYGPITDMYIGGGRESFEQCSTSCHTNHPRSRL